jgi:hypothetical protein
MFEYECWKCDKWHIIAEDIHERDAFDWGYEMEVDVRRVDTKESIIGKDRYWLEVTDGKA